MPNSNATIQPGLVLWITGFAGAGKSTVARRVIEILRDTQSNVVLIDGDEFRSLFSPDLGYDAADRLENAWRIARLTKFLSDQGIEVVVATVSLFGVVREWLAQSCPGYREIYIKVTQSTLHQRDQKNLYSGATAGERQNVAGVNLAVEEPMNPHLTIENDKFCDDFTVIAQRILGLRRS